MFRTVRILVVVIALAAPALADNLHEIAARVDRHYNQLRSLSAEFTESYRGGGVSRDESGVLWLKQPGKMRWEYRQPREKLFITDGKTAWFYVPGDRQGRKAPISKLEDLRSPLRLLLGKTKLEKEFSGLTLASLAPELPGDVVLRGVPNGMEDRISSVMLEVAPDGQIRRFKIEEVDGSVTEFRFANVVENPPVSDSQFKFTPPPGVEMIEGTGIGE